LVCHDELLKGVFKLQQVAFRATCTEKCRAGRHGGTGAVHQEARIFLRYAYDCQVRLIYELRLFGGHAYA
jgi:hypothetical protein